MKTPKLVTLYIIALIVFAAPLALRFADQNELPPGDEPYYHTRLAMLLSEQGFVDTDTVAQERLIFWNPYHMLFAGLSQVFSWESVMFFLPFILTFISIALFIMFLRKEKTKPFMLYASIVVFVLSPVTIALSTHSVPTTLAILFTFLGLLGMQRKKTWLATIAFALNASMGIFHGIMSLLFIWGYAKMRNRDPRWPWFVTLLTLLAIQVPRVINSSIKVPSFVQLGGFGAMLSDVGSVFGLSTFAVLLAIAGIPLMRKYKEKHYHLYVLVIFLFVATFFFNPLLPYTNLVVSVLAGMTITSIFKLRWKLPSIKNLTMIVIICGLLFSSISHITLEKTEGPTPSMVSALEWLNQHSRPSDRVFTHYTHAFWTEYFAERNVLVDPAWEGAKNTEQRYLLSQDIFDATDENNVGGILQKHNITFIMITSDFWEGLVWDKSEQGLHFLLVNSERFKKKFTSNNVEIWEYSEDKSQG